MSLIKKKKRKKVEGAANKKKGQTQRDIMQNHKCDCRLNNNAIVARKEPLLYCSLLQSKIKRDESHALLLAQRGLTPRC